ncbi:MAG TPA: response regulator [Chitinophagaceae bacterium]|nr:response regulator [Chitinophagaceae bacterium]
MMCVFRIVIFSLVSALATGTVFCQPYPYKFRYLTVDEGLSHIDANDIIQDKQGYIWIATYFGISRFDGYNIKKFYNTNEPLHNAYMNRVLSLCAGDKGVIWLGTEGGLQCFDAKTETYINYEIKGTANQPNFGKLIKPADNTIYGIAGGKLLCYTIHGRSIKELVLGIPAGLIFSDMAESTGGKLLLSTNKGVWRLDKNNVLTPVNIQGLPATNLNHIYINDRQNIMVAASRQLFLVNGNIDGRNLAVAKQFTCAAGMQINGITQDSKPYYWVNGGTGLIYLDNNLNLVQVITNKTAANSLNSSSLNKIYVDRSQCLWVCTFGGGVNYCDLNEKKFYTLQHNVEFPNSISGSYVRSVLSEDSRCIWIGTKNNGLTRFEPASGKTTFYNTYNSPLKLKSDDITALMLDNEHNLWIGSGAGIDILKAGKNELWKPAGSEKFPAYVIETLAKDCFGNIWFGNHTNNFGVIWKDDRGNFHVRYYGEGYFILPDTKKPQLLVSSTHGLKRLLIDQEGNIIKTYTYQATGSPNSLSSNYTYPICKQNDSTYWVGTIGGGLDKLVIRADNSYSVKCYNSNNGILTDVESLEIDDEGNIWMGGNGLECLNPSTGKLIRYDKNDGLQGNSFKVGSSCKGPDGRLYFGGINGLNYFYPAAIQQNLIPAQPVLTGLVINNKKFNNGNAQNSRQQIGYASSLQLSYLQNNFVISFSAMHYANPLKCRYRYKLEGYDKEWNYTDGKNPAAAYSNLDYSNYRFIVEAANNDGIWGRGQATIAVTITPPWWKSLPAKIVYTVLVIAVLAGIYIYQARWYRLKRELAIRAVNENKREEVHKQREELYRQQLQFFTNVSHEFRTPLTLILGPLEKLISDNINPALNSSYQLMFRNVKRLTNLITELMNFKKVADSAIKLQVKQLDVTDFCKSIYLEFADLALSKDINLTIADHTINDGEEQIQYFFDAQVLEKILFNLLNNALKYTHAVGSVKLAIFLDIEKFQPSFGTAFQIKNEHYRANKYIYFLVADTGVGISKDSIDSIFDRYYRVTKNHLGSGVGLALVKSLTQLHKGDIYVYSERYKGTEIIIGLPRGADNYTDAELAKPGNETVNSHLERIDTTTVFPAANDMLPGKQVHANIAKHILLVDDNAELRAFLKQSLESFYYISEAESGSSAITIAVDKMPDLIISDVMMPGMSGIELCKLVKETFETSHIPFIILSAKDALDTKIEGMESGADYYFAKPLSINLLLLTVHNIFQQAQKLKLKYTNNYLAEATELVHSEKDKKFMHQLLELIEVNMDNPGLDVDFLCTHLHTSRTKLYQKIKSVSDQSVGEFIKTIRLKKAIHIMTHEDIALNEVADRIGLQTGAYFSRVFKKEFGKSPSQFMQGLRKDERTVL